jgi:hypothetical protein
MGRFQGRIQDFKLRGEHLKKLRRAEGGAKMFGVFRVKNHDFTAKNHDFTAKNHIFSNIKGGARRLPQFIELNYIMSSDVDNWQQS